MLSLVTSSYSDLVKPKNLYPDELRGEDDGLYSEYSDLENIRSDAAEGYIDAKKAPRSQYNPMINFAILAHDTELPKRFYDGSVRQNLINAEKKVAELEEEMAAINAKLIDINKTQTF